LQESPYCIAVALINAQKGKLKNGFAFAGVNAFRATKIETIKNVFDSLISEYKTAAKATV
jgi:nitronate monooxygenase